MFGKAENGFPAIKEFFIATIADIILKHNLSTGFCRFVVQVFKA